MKVTVEGKSIPVGSSRIVSLSDEVLPQWFTEISGPDDAFQIESRGAHDFVKVLKPEAVTVERFQRI